MDADYRINFFQRDEDRLSSSERQFLGLAFNWQGWSHSFNRFDVKADYQYDVYRKSHLGMLTFSYHFGNDRGYQDFKPGEIDFKQLRLRKALRDSFRH